MMRHLGQFALKSIVQGHEDYMEAIDLVAQLGWKGKIVALHMQQYTTE